MNFPGQIRKCRVLLFVLLIIPVLLYSEQQTAENFPVYNLKGERKIFYRLIESLPDNGLAIVNFTSVTCLPCKKEIPELKALAESKGGEVMLLCIYAETADQVKTSAASLGVEENAYVDPFGAIRNKFNITKFPVTIVIDKKYKIIGRYEGYTRKNINGIKKICGM